MGCLGGGGGGGHEHDLMYSLSMYACFLAQFS